MDSSLGNIAILIPALNEEASIGSLIEGINRYCGDATIVVIDDASTDRTADVAASAGAIVLRLPIRLHAWGAMRTGFRYAQNRNFDIVITMDADGQHRPDMIAPLLEPIASKTADVVIGSCVERGSPGRKMAWVFFRWMTGLGVADLTSGFRVYNRSAVDIIMSSDTALLDYQDIGVLLALRKAGLKIVELPVLMCRRQNGISRIYASWANVFRYLLITSVLSVAKKEFSADNGPDVTPAFKRSV